MKRTSQGQSIVEYTILIVVVVVAIVVMRNYLERAWNANARGWEDSVRDSMMEDAVTNESSFYLHQKTSP